MPEQVRNENRLPDHVLARVTASLALPKPIDVTQLGNAWVHANYKLTFSQESGAPPLILRCLVNDPGHPTLENELAALHITSQIADLPTVERFHILAPSVAGVPAAVSDFIHGSPASSLVERGQFGQEIAHLVGTILYRIQTQSFDAFGTVGDGGRFVALKPSWREEWQQNVHRWAGLAVGGGADLGPVVDQLLQKIEDRMEALNSVSSFTLVHQDLHPGNLLVLKGPDGSPDVSGVIDWEGALIGDPLAEWAIPIETADGVLSNIVAGFGKEQVREFLSPEKIARLEVYAYTRLLARMGFASLAMFRKDRGRTRSLALERGRQSMDRLLKEGSVQARLMQALDHTVKGAAHFMHRPPLSAMLARRTLESFRYSPLPGSRSVPLLLSSLALSHMMPDLEDEGKQKAMGLGSQLLDHVNNQATPVFSDSGKSVDECVGAVMTQVVDNLASRKEPGFVLSLVLVAWALKAVDALDSLVSPHVFSGISRLVRILHEVENQGEFGNTKKNVVLGLHSILGLAALQGLHLRDANCGPPGFFESFEQGLLSQMRDSLALGSEDETIVPTRSVSEHLANTTFDTPQGVLLPSVMFALEELEAAGKLPASKEQILKALDY